MIFKSQKSKYIKIYTFSNLVLYLLSFIRLIFLFIFWTCRTSLLLYLSRLSSYYPNLVLATPKYCCPVKNYLFCYFKLHLSYFIDLNSKDNLRNVKLSDYPFRLLEMPKFCSSVCNMTRKVSYCDFLCVKHDQKSKT